ncbi:MAG: ATP-binding protein [Bryobacteraceae bacterium]
MFSAREVTPRTIFRVLLGGFLLVIALLMTAGFVAVENIRSIRDSADRLASQELVATRLLEDVQREQAALSAVFRKLSRGPELEDREKILAELDEADDRLEEISAWVAGTPEEPLWNELKRASNAFSAEARRLLNQESPSTLLSRDLFRRHEEALALVARLAAASYAKAANAKQQIHQRSRELLWNSVALLGSSLLLALGCAALTVRLATGMLRKMEAQATELSRVSWHLLENQETVARRFSHELHDELGQSLTAVKANLLALRTQRGINGRVEDCVKAVDRAIQNVRELSQLLHPTILDDFGLDAGLRWLAEGFMQRTGIEVEYQSDFKGRLPEEIETHLFRICQEALTNVARHSGASKVRIQLCRLGDEVRVSVADNGRGLPADGSAMREGLGLIGMRARARSAGGEVRFSNQSGGGLKIEVRVPARDVPHEQEKDSGVARR